MTKAVVLDTNVAVVANGKAHQASPDCVAACIRTLRETKERSRVTLDSGGLILQEYRKRLSFSGQPGPGDAFFKWVWNNQANTNACLKVEITQLDMEGKEFKEFPDDLALAGFDPSDRKFVAVAISSQCQPPILNASDTDWWTYCDALRKHGVEIKFICRELMPGGD